MSERRADLDRFYALLAELEGLRGGKRLLAECHGRMGWPQRGVYFFFEDGELRDDGVTPRVVRVGTHALQVAANEGCARVLFYGSKCPVHCHNWRPTPTKSPDPSHHSRTVNLRICCHQRRR